ncbi:MAG TPA: cytochrome C oxidase subunit I [Burkholderiales bacterium]|nr:cytochrome C oxidase subunit I [Burkholderiales bacterium]
MAPKAKIFLIFLVCAAPIALATAAWHFRWGTPATANYGELIEPRALDAPPFRALRGKWLLVTFDAAACDARCEEKLFVVRQVRRAQGAEAERIERLWLVTDGGQPRPRLLAAIEGSHVEPARAAGSLQAFPGELERHIYLVDPLGNLMMRYPAAPRPAGMIKDFERLLKVSRVG